jgi:hypothetical protein
MQRRVKWRVLLLCDVLSAFVILTLLVPRQVYNTVIYASAAHSHIQILDTISRNLICHILTSCQSKHAAGRVWSKISARLYDTPISRRYSFHLEGRRWMHVVKPRITDVNVQQQKLRGQEWQWRGFDKTSYHFKKERKKEKNGGWMYLSCFGYEAVSNIDVIFLLDTNSCFGFFFFQCHFQKQHMKHLHFQQMFLFTPECRV